MTRGPVSLVALVACACAGEPVVPLGCDDGPADLEIRVHDGEFGSDNAALPYGRPPQGGAAYTPIALRMRGLVPELELEATVTDEGGEPIGVADVRQRLICSNTGEQSGWYVGAEVHLRYLDQPYEALEGQQATLEVWLTDPEGQQVSAAVSGELVWEL